MICNSKEEQLEKALIEFQNKIIDKRKDFKKICSRCKIEKKNLEVQYHNLQLKKKKLADSGDIQNLVKTDHQYCEQLKSLMENIEQLETTLKSLENEKQKLSEQDNSQCLEKSHVAKEITGIKWTSHSKKIQGFIKNKQNCYIKYFSIKNDENSNVIEQLYKEIRKSASSNWDDLVTEA